MRDFITSKDRVQSDLDRIHNKIGEHAAYYAMALTLVIFYILFITSNLGN